MSVVVSLATSADVADVHALDALCFGVDGWSRESVERELIGPNRHALVAREDGRLVAYAISAFSADVMDLQRIAVVPELRRSGLARRLFNTLCQEGAAARAQRVMLEVSAANEAGIGFYQRCGLVEVARRPAYYRDGSDALVMERALWPDDEETVEAHLAAERDDVAELAELARPVDRDEDLGDEEEPA